MTSRRTTPLNFNIDIHNTTSAPIKFAYNESFDQVFIKDMEDYSLTVSSLKIPTVGLETFVMDNPNDYSIMMYGNTVNRLNANTVRTLPLPTVDTVDSDPFATALYICNGGNISYYSPQQFMEIVNRTMYRVYRNFTRATYDNNASPYTMSVILNQTSTGQTNVSATYTSTPFSNNIPYVIADAEVILGGFTLVQSGTSNPLNSPFNVWLQAPGGNKQVIFSCNGMNRISQTNIILSEAAYRPFSNTLDSTALTKAVYYQPMTSFVTTLHGVPFWTSAGPNVWTFGVSSNSAFQGGMNLQLRLTLVLPTGFGSSGNMNVQYYLPPALSLDSSSKKVTFTYQNFLAENQITIAFSPKLYGILNLGHTFQQYNPTTGYYDVIYPRMSPTLTSSQPLFILQEQSTMYNMTNIAKVYLKSNALRCEYEYGSSLVADSTISDFKVNTDSEYLGDLLYSTDAGNKPWRRYRFIGRGQMRMIDVQFMCQYDNGLTREIYIAPGLTGQARLTFFNEINQ